MAGIDRKHAVVAGGVLLLVLAVLIVWAAPGESDNASGPRGDSSQAGADGAVGEEQDAHQTCALQLSAMVAHLVDDPDAVVEETQVNGVNDPFLQPSRNLYSEFVRDQMEVGNNEALQNLLSNAASVCGTDLNDQLRPNYPTDGSY